MTKEQIRAQVDMMLDEVWEMGNELDYYGVLVGVTNGLAALVQSQHEKAASQPQLPGIFDQAPGGYI